MQNVIRPVNIQAILALEIKACLESLGQRIGVGADLCRRVDKWEMTVVGQKLWDSCPLGSNGHR